MPSPPLSWTLRKRFWSWWQTTRFRLARPQHIEPPKRSTQRIGSIPLDESHPDIPIHGVRVFDRLPSEERSLGMRLLVATGLMLNRLIPQSADGLPEIDVDIDAAMRGALLPRYRRAFRSPVRPHAFPKNAPPIIEELAVASPYGVLVARGNDGMLEWDLRHLASYEHHPGLRSLGLRVVFAETPDTEQLRAMEIESDAYGIVKPGEARWGMAVRLAICAATTHLSLTRHFNYVHLVSGDHWEVASRNALSRNHPMYRLVWPHIYNSLYTNHGVTRVQLGPDGDFVHMFSFTHRGLIECYEDMYRAYDIRVTDPDADWKRRGLGDAKFTSPTQENLKDLFELMLRHTSRYVRAYYDSDETLRADPEVTRWLEELDALIPNGLNGELTSPLTREGLARLVAAYMYEGNTVHDLVGTTLWDYQLWADANPTRVYRDGRRVPVDVFQRVINNNFALQLQRAPMLADYGQVAIDDRGRKLFTEFYEECLALQRRYDETPAGPWRMEPRNLEISMNG